MWVYEWDSEVWYLGRAVVLRIVYQINLVAGMKDPEWRGKFSSRENVLKIFLILQLIPSYEKNTDYVFWIGACTENIRVMSFLSNGRCEWSREFDNFYCTGPL